MKRVLFILLFAYCSLFTVHHSFGQSKTYSLKECIDQALQKNIQLNQTELTSQLNKVNLNQAKMNLYPNLNFTDAHSFNWGYAIDPNTYQSTKQSFSTNNPSLTSTVTLFNGFLLNNTIKQNKLFYDAGNYDTDKMKNDISLSVVSAYLQLLYSYEAVDIAKAQMATTAEQVDRTKKYVDAGKLAESNLLQIQSQLASDNAAVVNAENQLQIAKVTLMQLMEMPIIDNFEIDRTAMTEPPLETILPPSDIYKTSENIMPEIKSAEMKTTASEIGIKLAQSYDMPKLSLTGLLKSGYSSDRSKFSSTTVYQNETIGYVQNNLSDPVFSLLPVTTVEKQNYSLYNQFKDNFGQAISLSLTVPIFNNYQGKYGLQKAEISLKNTKLNEEDTKITLRKTVEQVYTDLTAAVKNYAAAKEGLTSEERAYKDLEKKYNLGIITATDYLIEKNNFEKATLALTQAKFTYIFKSKIVDFYLGKPLTN